MAAGWRSRRRSAAAALDVEPFLRVELSLLAGSLVAGALLRVQYGIHARSA